MDKIVRFDTVGQYNAFNNLETLHPLVSVVDLSKVDARQHARMNFGFYTVFLLDDLNAEGIIVTGEQKAGIYGPTGLDIGVDIDTEGDYKLLSKTNPNS